MAGADMTPSVRARFGDLCEQDVQIFMDEAAGPKYAEVMAVAGSLDHESLDFRYRSLLGEAPPHRHRTLHPTPPHPTMPEFLRLDDDAPARRLAYIGATLLIVIPFLQAGQQLWPLQLSDIRWRFGAANALSSVLLLPFLGLSIMTLIARSSESKNVSRIVGALASLSVIFLLGSLVLFALDALQLKSIVTSQMMKPFETTSLRVVLVTLIFTVSFSMLMITAFKSARGTTPMAKKGAKQAEEGRGLIVGQ